MSPTSSLTKDGKLHNFKTTPSVACKQIQMEMVIKNIPFFKDGTKWSKEIFNSSGELTDTLIIITKRIY